MIKDLFKDGYIPYFELVSKKYRVVLDYDEENLFITQIIDIGIASKITSYVEKTYKYVVSIPSTFLYYDRKTFYEKNKNYEYIHIIMKFYNKSCSDYDIIKHIINEVLKKTNSYHKTLDL